MQCVDREPRPAGRGEPERTEDAELRAEADKMARIKAEHLYSMAIMYLRKVIRWIDQNLPGESYPPPPPELKLDL